VNYSFATPPPLGLDHPIFLEHVQMMPHRLITQLQKFDKRSCIFLDCSPIALNDFEPCYLSCPSGE